MSAYLSCVETALAIFKTCEGSFLWRIVLVFEGFSDECRRNPNRTSDN